ncbi:MAG: NAD-dependent epimerase/dehydratase family protein [Candidatus Falkowbacteria bacterium]
MQEFYKGKNVLITGGVGFIGSSIAKKLVEFGANVFIMDSMCPDYGGNLFNIESIKSSVNVNISDMRDPYSTEYLVKGKDVIFNLAGQVSHIDSMKNPFQDLEINCTAQLSLLELCRKVNPAVKIVFASTRQIYGRAEYLPLDEKHIVNPIDVNGINKAAGERYHTLYNNIYGIKACALRLTNTYGPRQLIKHNKQGFIAWFINRLVTNNKIAIFGDGMQTRDFNYIDDVVNAFLVAGKNSVADGEVFNLGGTEPVTLKALTEQMIEINGAGEYELVPFPDEKKQIDLGSCSCSFDKIKNVLGWVPVVSLRDGLIATLNYYKEHKAHYL